MNYIDRLTYLKEMHRMLDKNILEHHANSANQQTITNLKKQKLAIKDEIARLERLEWELSRNREQEDYDNDYR